MARYIVERTITEVGTVPIVELERLAASWLAVLEGLGGDITWLHSYVVANKFYCVFDAATPELIHEHARRCQFPIDTIAQVTSVIGPATARRV
jgi:hypothetical protein